VIHISPKEKSLITYAHRVYDDDKYLGRIVKDGPSDTPWRANGVLFKSRLEAARSLRQ
jgi:hypothetical protein